MFVTAPPAVVVFATALERRRVAPSVRTLERVPPRMSFLGLSVPEPVGLVVSAPRVPRRSARQQHDTTANAGCSALGVVPLPSSGTTLSAIAE